MLECHDELQDKQQSGLRGRGTFERQLVSLSLSLAECSSRRCSEPWSCCVGPRGKRKPTWKGSQGSRLNGFTPSPVHVLELSWR